MTFAVNSRYSPLPAAGVFRWLAELSSATSGQSPFVLILDLSDSFSTPDHELNQIPKLCGRLHRDTPLWIYRLSSAQPLDSGQDRLAHLVDGSLDVRRFFTDRKLRSIALTQGSFIRPPLQAITQRVTEIQGRQVPVLVLTDGALLDIAETPVDPRIQLRGLTSQKSPANLHAWRRVLSRTPLAFLADELWAEWPGENRGVTGILEIEFDSTEFAVSDGEASEFRPLVQQRLTWDTRNGPLLLAGKSPSEARLTIRRPSESHASAEPLTLGPRLPPLAPELVERAASSLARSSAKPRETYLDLYADDPRFAAIWNECCRAAQLIQEGRPWTVECLRPWIMDGDHHPPCDALVCLTLDDPRHDAGQRLILIPLNKRQIPALVWTPGNSPAGTVISDSVRIEFDRMERRWKYTAGQAIVELSPIGGEFLRNVDLRSDHRPWSLIFCGLIE